MALVVTLVALLGLCISLYAYWVDRQLLINAEYKAVCDLSDKVSCTKPFESPYSKLLGFSNTVVGILFYTSMFWLAIANYPKTLFLLSLASVIASLYLAFILFTKIKSLCLICIAIYLVNILLCIASYYNLYS